MWKITSFVRLKKFLIPIISPLFLKCKKCAAHFTEKPQMKEKVYKRKITEFILDQ